MFLAVAEGGAFLPLPSSNAFDGILKGCLFAETGSMIRDIATGLKLSSVVLNKFTSGKRI